MKAPADSDLLPGAEGPGRTPPKPVFNPKKEVVRARRVQSWRDAIDLMLLLAVDIFFYLWKDARLPFTTRDVSLTILLVNNAVVIALALITRLYPVWKARRIAATWSAEERRRSRK